jgi:3-hydroxyisobutyrate dehydrogenase-like beta-hydroxyacid dehydrogenase
MKKIGVIGAGIMATGMAQNFLKHDYEVFVWNRSKAKLEPLIANGAQSLETPKAVTETSDIIIECVSDDEASKDVWQGNEGILAGANDSKVLIASSSLSLNWTDELAQQCKTNGYKFMDMPLTGSRAGAENGTLRLLIGAESEVLESVRSDLEAISEKIYHFGEPGAGMRFKLVLNSLIGIHMNATAQALRLAQKAGIDPEVFGNALIDGTMGPASPSAKLVIDSANWERGHVNFAIDLLTKDLRYAKEMASQYDFDFDLLNDTQSDYQHAQVKGLGELDVTSIKELFSDK